jgi:hypothetical protein
MANPSTKTDICNLALSRIGAATVTSAEISADSSVNAQHCNRHYEQTRDALLRSHYWRFASARADLTENASSPDFEFDNQFDLPSDFLRLKSVFSDDGTETENTKYSYAVEGNLLLTDDDEVSIRYVKQETDVSNFDSLFIETFVLSLALKLVMPITQDVKLYAEIKDELYNQIMPRVRAMDRQETNTTGRYNRRPWVEARLLGGGTWRQDRV